MAGKATTLIGTKRQSSETAESACDIDNTSADGKIEIYTKPVFFVASVFQVNYTPNATEFTATPARVLNSSRADALKHVVEVLENTYLQDAELGIEDFGEDKLNELDPEIEAEEELARLLDFSGERTVIREAARANENDIRKICRAFLSDAGDEKLHSVSFLIEELDATAILASGKQVEAFVVVSTHATLSEGDGLSSWTIKQQCTEPLATRELAVEKLAAFANRMLSEYAIDGRAGAIRLAHRNKAVCSDSAAVLLADELLDFTRKDVQLNATCVSNEAAIQRAIRGFARRGAFGRAENDNEDGEDEDEDDDEEEEDLFVAYGEVITVDLSIFAGPRTKSARKL